MKAILAAALVIVVALPVIAEPMPTPSPPDPAVLAVAARLTVPEDDAVIRELERIESDPVIRAQAEEEAAYPINSF